METVAWRTGFTVCTRKNLSPLMSLICLVTVSALSLQSIGMRGYFKEISYEWRTRKEVGKKVLKDMDSVLCMAYLVMLFQDNFSSSKNLPLLLIYLHNSIIKFVLYAQLTPAFHCDCLHTFPLWNQRKPQCTREI